MGAWLSGVVGVYALEGDLGICSPGKSLGSESGCSGMCVSGIGGVLEFGMMMVSCSTDGGGF